MSPGRLKLWAKTTDEVIKAKAIVILLLHFMTLLAERRSELVQLAPELARAQKKSLIEESSWRSVSNSR